MAGDCQCPPPFIPQRNGTCGVCARPMRQRPNEDAKPRRTLWERLFGA